MSFTREKIRDFYLLATDVENIFINEYMPAAPGDFVKVYLYGLLYSQNDAPMSYDQMARQLSMSRKRIDEAWDYWASMGVVEKSPEDSGDYDIKFRQMRALMYGKEEKPLEVSSNRDERTDSRRAGDTGLYDQSLKELLVQIEKLKGTGLSSAEIKEIFSLTEDDGASPEVVFAACEYCFEKGKTGINYIAKVVREWTKEGLRSRDDVKDRLSALDQRMGVYKRILRTLGLNRGATEAEKEMIDSWLDEMKFNLDKVLEACTRASFISSPNLRYVNRVLLNWFEEARISGRNVNSSAGVTQAVLSKYYAYLREKAEEEAQARRAEVYKKIPRIREVDEDLLELGQNISRAVLSGDSLKLNEMKRLMKLLEEERAVLLTENNYREDYTDVKYACDKCGDTGMTEDGNRCSCTKERMGEAELWQSSTSSKK